MDYIQKDRSLLEYGAGEIKDYLLSDQLFWPLNSGERLTLGTLLLALLRSQCLAQTPAEIQKIDDINQQISILRGKWRTNWSNKATLEFHSRLRQWELALREMLSREQRNTVLYTHEVTSRVILSLLQSEILQTELAAYDHLLILDKQLHAASHKSEFIWDPNLKGQFPKEHYWFLYCSPTPGE